MCGVVYLVFSFVYRWFCSCISLGGIGLLRFSWWIMLVGGNMVGLFVILVCMRCCDDGMVDGYDVLLVRLVFFCFDSMKLMNFSVVFGCGVFFGIVIMLNYIVLFLVGIMYLI